MSADLNLKEEVRPLARVREWEMNPRGSKYEGMDELEESLAMVGLQDAIHVWERPDGDYLLKGHRRFRAMGNLGWTECRMVAHRFEDEAEAFLYLLQDHGHTVALNSDEKLVAMGNGVKMGLTAAELAPALGVTEERAQLWFDLGVELPQNGREALATGKLSLNVAELILRVEKEDRAKAVQLVLHDSITNEPMGASQAKNFIDAQYVMPAKWRRDWLAKGPKLKKKYATEAGFVIVPWEDRRLYVMGDSGQPETDYEYGDGTMGRGGELWMTRAQAMGVPVYVVAAPRHADGQVLVVHKRMLRDAESALVRQKEEEGVASETERAEARTTNEETETERAEARTTSTEPERAEARTTNEDALGRWLQGSLRRIYEHLCNNPTDVMTSGPWKPLYGYLSGLVTQTEYARAAEVWLGVQGADEVLAWMQKDTKQRAPLRMALMMLLCAESDANQFSASATIKAVAEGLGVVLEGGEV